MRETSLFLVIPVLLGSYRRPAVLCLVLTLIRKSGDSPLIECRYVGHVSAISYAVLCVVNSVLAVNRERMLPDPLRRSPRKWVCPQLHIARHLKPG